MPGMNSPRQTTGEEDGGTRFEAPDAAETIGRDLPSSVLTQPLTAESEAGEERIKPNRPR